MNAIFILLSVVASQPESTAGKPVLLIPRLQATGVKSHESKAISTALCHAVSKLNSHEVLCSDDLEAMVKWNVRAAQLNACKNDDCLAKAAEAMKAKLVVTGSLSKIDTSYVLSVALLDVKSGKVLKRHERKEASLSKLYDVLPDAAVGLLPQK